MVIVLFSDLFTNKTIHVHVYRSRGRRHVFPVRKRCFDDYFQLRFHIHYHNRFYVHAAYADIIEM